MGELDDVQLDVALVSDDPNTWIVPTSLVAAWDAHQALSADQALFEWWENLHVNDQRIHEAYGSERRAALKELVQEYDAIRADYRDTLDDQRELRRVVVRMIQMDLTTEQVAKILCVPRVNVVRMVAWNSAETQPDEADTRIVAEDMLRAGSRYSEVSRAVGLPEWVVRRWGVTLGIPPREGGLGMAPRNRALELHDQGHNAKRIVEILQQEFPHIEVKRMTVYKWINRRKHEEAGKKCQE